MQSVFTTFASSRFVDRQAVVDILRTLARRLKAQQAQIAAVHLFGSFACGTAGPRSDADIVIEISRQDADLVGELLAAAHQVFSESPVPVDVYVLPSDRLCEGPGIGGAVAREGIRLA